jgi:hypothetical protein
MDKVDGTLPMNPMCLGNARRLSFKTNPPIDEALRSLGFKDFNLDITELIDRGESHKRDE